MDMTRRDLAAAGALAFAAAAVMLPSAASAADEEAVTKAIDEMRKAVLTQDKAKLEALSADQLSYGHSSAVVQNKAEFVNGVMTRKGTAKSLDFPEMKLSVMGNAAVARHLYVATGELDGKPNDVKIGALEVWQKQGNDWKLIARQGYKLA